VARYHAAADLIVAPFQRVLTSSSVMLAMSMARPVVAPALGCLPELVSPDAGLLYEPSESAALRDALVAAMDMPLEQMGQRAFEIAASQTWDETARVVADAYGKANAVPGLGP
jgi:glycosyltransferase involved in cell wall biosynthesis